MLKENDMIEIYGFIPQMTYPQLSIIYSLMDSQKKMLGNAIKQDIALNDKVTFLSSKEGIITGKVIKKMRKNVLIRQDLSRTRWTVSPVLLTKINEKEAERA